MEFVNAFITGLVGLILVVGVGICLLASQFPGTAGWSVGRRAQDVILVFLWLVLVGFVLVLGTDVIERYAFNVHNSQDPCGLAGVRALFGFRIGVAPQTDRELSSELMTIYMTSSIRLVPWLAMLVGPLRIILSTAVDVLYYILPGEFMLSIGKDSRDRLSKLLLYLEERQDPAVALIAHSQGSVVAYDVLQLQADKLAHKPKLITVGSPLGSLYSRFLDYHIKPLGTDWNNFYRTSDYIGGKIGSKVVMEKVIDENYKSAHFGYFTDPTVIESALQALPSQGT
jgi:hypothetical protein